MKKIVITGGLGYIGMELAKVYSGKAKDYKIYVLDNEFHPGRVSRLNKWGIKFIQCNILDKVKLKPFIEEADIIFHLAGITDVPTTSDEVDINHDKLVSKVGIKGSQNIINLASKNAKIIFPSTHVVFEGLDKITKNINEKYLPSPELNYSIGKVQTEQDLIASKKNYIILRLGSVYGYSGDSTRINIMTNLFSKITAENGVLKLFGGGEQYKSLVSVFDVARCMEYVAEKNSINNEIFNCVSENYQVKEVAKICSEINNKVEIITTKDNIPNLGYTLSNKKITQQGFKFQFGIKDSIKEMINEWKFQPTNMSQEIIETGKDDFIDNRGLITNYYMNEPIDMIGYVESKKESVRGNHYHPVQTQKCILLSGKYISITKDLLKKDSVVETRIINSGEISTIPPNVAHTMVFLEDSTFVNLVSGNRDHKNFNQTHTLKYELVDEDFSKFLTSNYKTDCRACNSNSLEMFLSLGLSPLANNLLDSKNSKFKQYPLELVYCKNCTNIQLSTVVPPQLMFDEYLYVSSTSKNFINHFENFANKIAKELKLKNSSLVIDIGSNDGVFLKPLKNLGIQILGIDPARNIVKIANSRKLKTILGYLNKNLVEKILKDYKKADLVTAFNVFAHNDNLHEMIDNIEKLLKPRGSFIFEVQYIVDNIEDELIDNIYHEHVNYWSVTALKKFFENHKLFMYKVEHIDTHGGSIRVYCSKNSSELIHKSVASFISKEKKFGIHNIKKLYEFNENVNFKKKKSLQKIENFKNNKEVLIGYGAPAKATTLLNFYNITSKDINFVIDDNPLKNKKFIPGTGIQILNKDSVAEKKIYKIIVLAWNFYDSIVNKNQSIYLNSSFDRLN
jgi:nucleoside-diphosphate-sugar epimerase/SAM-dependent methyltransferase/dTDP-4-dehydrorhamnose 3,5-epimerase-like enzyme